MTVLYDASSQSGKTAIYRAAEMGLVEVVQGLLAGELDVDARCHADGFTPLAIACIQGKLEIVQLLLSAGADSNIRDHYGWLPKDHAAFLGYPKIVDAIKQPASDFLSPRPGEQLDAFFVLPQPSAGECVIFLDLGTFDLHKNAEKIDLKPYEAKLPPAAFLETSFELTIATEPHSQEYCVPLPDPSAESDGPICFTTKYSDETKIIFKLFNVVEQEPVGVAVALLSQLKQGLGPKRESLVRDFTIPIVSSKHGHIGTIMFTFVVASPTDPTLSPPSKPQRLNSAARTLLVGHRGNGMNISSYRQLQLGENTVQSFLTAIDLGADAVETDIQLTKDDVAVVYHDFLVTEKGSDAAMHTITYEQFNAINTAQSGYDSGSHTKRLPWDERARPRPPVPRRRSRSLCAPQDCDTAALVRQMEHTLNYPGNKGNIRSENVHERYLTLEQMFHSMPDNIPLLIEIKYPMLYEANDFKMDTFAPEVNHFLDTILAVIYAHAGPRRQIILASFSPEVCMVLAVKQQTYPILFGSDASNYPTGDQRVTSTQRAVRLAYRFGLAGVLMASEPFVASPGLVGLVTSQGLYLATYGPLNDDTNCAKIQAEAGVNMLIVDRVKHVRQALDGMEGA